MLIAPTSRPAAPPAPSRLVLLATLGLCLAATARGQSDQRWRAMNQPVEPLRLVGPIHYVGANDVASYLIATPEGHILIDGGFEETAPMIRANVEKLGFRLEDVEILLHSHAHFDHVGGLARLKEWSGAELWASAADAPRLAGGGEVDVPLLGEAARFPPVRPDRLYADGETVKLGGVELVARVTAGHTPGCTSWDTTVREGESELRVVSICSLSVLDGMRFGDDPTYPGIAADFERSFETLAAIPADVFLASHASFFGLERKRALVAAGNPNPFVDAEGYRAFVARARERFRRALEAEAER
ncbi:MAG TPA: subclass B3 metallo-beta-lactamase [Thermoanaerobaculia bacterium]|nr:subclass B3 metallo-beta-lactamase [Thermoanaerobaculia bacterium]